MYACVVYENKRFSAPAGQYFCFVSFPPSAVYTTWASVTYAETQNLMQLKIILLIQTKNQHKVQ